MKSRLNCTAGYSRHWKSSKSWGLALLPPALPTEKSLSRVNLVTSLTIQGNRKFQPCKARTRSKSQPSSLPTSYASKPPSLKSKCVFDVCQLYLNTHRVSGAGSLRWAESAVNRTGVTYAAQVLRYAHRVVIIGPHLTCLQMSEDFDLWTPVAFKWSRKGENAW